MDDQYDEDQYEELELPTPSALKPVQLGRALPVPPVVPLIALFAILFGLALGYGLSSKPSPVPSQSPVSASLIALPLPFISADPSLLPLIEPTASATSGDRAPSDGLTLGQALDALQKSGMGVSPSAILSARVARDREVSSSYANPTDQWVWAVVVQGDFSGPRACPSRFDDPGTRAPCGMVATTQMILLDYRTGSLVEAYAIAQ